MRKQTKIWTQKDGTKIRICDMTDNHLKNTINFLYRQAHIQYENEIASCAACNFQGEMAQMEQDNFLASAEWSDYLPEIYNNLLLEASNRDIKIP